VIATISMFYDVRDWNRNNIEKYYEVYLKVPIDVLCVRDQKKLYSRAKDTEDHNVVGFNVQFEEPTQPDIVLLNDGSLTPEALVDSIFINLREKTTFL